MTPLAGCRILITRERSAATELAEGFRRLGAVPICLPTLQIAPPAEAGPLSEALAHVADFDWLLFTSANSVSATITALFMADESAPAVRLAGIKLAAVGPASQQALAEYGLEADLVPSEHTAWHLAQALGGHPAFESGQRILLPRSQLARPELVADLAALGAVVCDVVAYRTIGAPPEPEALATVRAGLDVATFTSGSAAANFMQLVGGELPSNVLDGVKVASIGPSTSAVLRQLGVAVDIEASDHTTGGLVDAVAKAWGGRRSQQRT